MNVVIAGSRGITDFRVLHRAVEKSGFKVDEVVSGGARGVDTLGEEYASDNGIPVRLFKPDWDKHGKAAGPIRNRQMAEYADALIALWDGESRGTKNMIEEMQKLGKPVHVEVVKCPK